MTVSFPIFPAEGLKYNSASTMEKTERAAF